MNGNFFITLDIVVIGCLYRSGQMQWIRTDIEVPPMGLKVLCFKDGDCWTAYRFLYGKKNAWIPCIPSSSLNPEREYQLAKCDEPEYWTYIPFDDLPGTCHTGYMKVKVEKDFITMDEFYKLHPKYYNLFVSELFINKK